MKITGLKLVSHSVVDLKIFGAQPTDSHILKGVDGLGPVDKTLVINNGALQAEDVTDREVTLLVGLNPDWSSNETASDMREHYYKMLSGAVTLNVMDDPTVICYTVGHLKRIEIVPFSKDPQIQIVMNCLGSYLEAPESIEPALVMVEDPSAGMVRVIDNVGSAPVGFYARFRVDEQPTDPPTVSTSYIFGRLPLTSVPQPAMIIENFDFQVDDEVIINTIDGSLDVRVNRGGSNISLLSYLNNTYSIDQWWKLLPGENQIIISPPYFTWVDFMYTPRYWGI
jgi:hypothetical protein